MKPLLILLLTITFKVGFSQNGFLLYAFSNKSNPCKAGKIETSSYNQTKIFRFYSDSTFYIDTYFERNLNVSCVTLNLKPSTTSFTTIKGMWEKSDDRILMSRELNNYSVEHLKLNGLQAELIEGVNKSTKLYYMSGECRNMIPLSTPTMQE